MKGPWRALLVQGSSQIFDFLQPAPNEKKYSSWSKDWLDPKPGPKFEFAHCLKVYKKINEFGPWKVRLNSNQALNLKFYKIYTFVLREVSL